MCFVTMLLIGCSVALVLPLTAPAVNQDTYRNITAQSDGEEGPLVTIYRIENNHTSTVGWQNATKQIPLVTTVQKDR